MLSKKKTKPNSDRLDKVVAEARRNQALREQSYREQALKLYPWICGRCGREFSGKNLQELTVHHKDHNHDNNPPNGSNWELLCLYCHDNEHSRYLEEAQYGSGVKAGGEREQASTHKPFADLEGLLKNKK
ncbi:MAG: HNH nuclease family protein [Candidatus Parabeggiatoa sp. nov. 2]|nr:MAG: HNH endonuclease [Beggiatoa sp. 4572_84]RKZ56908.1 MAG: HNH nuclease family protein [Gammaproteobacteria bacterium]HEC84165.1 HNH nuclease family protein [Thioploca sp.]